VPQDLQQRGDVCQLAAALPAHGGASDAPPVHRRHALHHLAGSRQRAHHLGLIHNDAPPFHLQSTSMQEQMRALT
jgi:hypothetical protein